MTRHAASAPPLRSALEDVAEQADYSLLDSLNADPASTDTGEDHEPRQVFSGHYVPVRPTPIGDPEYIAHSPALFAELGFSDDLARDPDFVRFFSGDLRTAPAPLRRHGWATGYALSIYGREYYQQCPFGTGNGYGDGRAISVLEGRFRGPLRRRARPRRSRARRRPTPRNGAAQRNPRPRGRCAGAHAREARLVSSWVRVFRAVRDSWAHAQIRRSSLRPRLARDFPSH